MKLRVEFFGIARQRAGVARAELELPDNQTTMEAVFAALSAMFPGLKDECIAEGRLRSGFSANLGGERFISDPATLLTEHDCLLILSADAGG